jgi:putative PIN family toxin of toxin-antitoxin system
LPEKEAIPKIPGDPQNPSSHLPLLKFVVDSNVWIDAYSNEGNKKRNNMSAAALQKATSEGIVVHNKHTRKDLYKALRKLTNNIKLTEKKAGEIWEKFLLRTTNVSEKEPLEKYKNKYKEKLSKCPDDDDKAFLSLANEQKASYIISNDNDLLGMKEYMGVKIITPGTFGLENLPIHRQPDRGIEQSRGKNQGQGR